MHNIGHVRHKWPSKEFYGLLCSSFPVILLKFSPQDTPHVAESIAQLGVSENRTWGVAWIALWFGFLCDFVTGRRNNGPPSSQIALIRVLHFVSCNFFLLGFSLEDIDHLGFIIASPWFFRKLHLRSCLDCTSVWYSCFSFCAILEPAGQLVWLLRHGGVLRSGHHGGKGHRHEELGRPAAQFVTAPAFVHSFGSTPSHPGIYISTNYERWLFFWGAGAV